MTASFVTVRGMEIALSGKAAVACAHLERHPVMQLRVPHDGSRPSIMDGLRRAGHPPRPAIPVDLDIAREMIAARYAVPYAQIPLLRRMTPERDGDVAGWRECGYDGDAADWYCFSV
jgi:hypothetical protein